VQRGGFHHRHLVLRGSQPIVGSQLLATVIPVANLKLAGRVLHYAPGGVADGTQTGGGAVK